MKHTKEAIHRHNSLTGWMVVGLIIYVVFGGFISRDIDHANTEPRAVTLEGGK